MPPGRIIIGNRWVFKIKRNEDGNINNREISIYRACLVVKGCLQRRNLNYEETYAPIACLTTMQTLLSIVQKTEVENQTTRR